MPGPFDSDAAADEAALAAWRQPALEQPQAAMQHTTESVPQPAAGVPFQQSLLQPLQQQSWDTQHQQRDLQQWKAQQAQHAQQAAADGVSSRQQQPMAAATEAAHAESEPEPQIPLQNAEWQLRSQQAQQQGWPSGQWPPQMQTQHTQHVQLLDSSHQQLQQPSSWGPQAPSRRDPQVLHASEANGAEHRQQWEPQAQHHQPQWQPQQPEQSTAGQHDQPPAVTSQTQQSDPALAAVDAAHFSVDAVPPWQPAEWQGTEAAAWNPAAYEQAAVQNSTARQMVPLQQQQEQQQHWQDHKAQDYAAWHNHADLHQQAGASQGEHYWDQPAQQPASAADHQYASSAAEQPLSQQHMARQWPQLPLQQQAAEETPTELASGGANMGGDSQSEVHLPATATCEDAVESGEHGKS